MYTTTKQTEGLSGAQVVVAKSWSGWEGYNNRENEAAVRRTLFDWIIDSKKMAGTDNAGFMHCLPVRRNVVVTDAVINGPNSWTKETAGLRMWTAIALLENILGEA